MADLIFVCAPDIAGKLRGKAFPSDQLELRLTRGVGWTPTNVQITCFNVIAESPFGALGDLLLIPDGGTVVEAVFGDRTERFMLGDIVTLDGAPWDLCTRAILRSALDRLEQVGGVRLLAAFEHEFQIKGSPAVAGEAYGRAGFEAQRDLCETLVDQLTAAGLSADSIMKEYGPNQYEVVIGPEDGQRAADAAVIVRELTRSTARHLGDVATFAPILDPASVGNGAHIHMSFLDETGAPVAHDPNRPHGMSQLTGAFCAGVLKYLDSILALTAPSVVSYLRLTPNRWSAAYNNLGLNDREAALRLCPVTPLDPASLSRQFNIEFRAGDAAACPHLALAAIVHAGCAGIEEGLAAPDPTEENLSHASAQSLKDRGFVRLPTSFDDALDRFAANDTVKSWFPDPFAGVYVAHKKAEIAHVADMDPRAQCDAYAETY
ncbi:MAG: glutamine synthetase family protein [Pseudomonadota bacterium]